MTLPRKDQSIIGTLLSKEPVCASYRDFLSLPVRSKKFKAYVKYKITQISFCTIFLTKIVYYLTYFLSSRLRVHTNIFHCSLHFFLMIESKRTMFRSPDLTWKKWKQLFSFNFSSHLSSNAVVVKFRERQGWISLPRPPLVGINEFLREGGPEEDIVRAAGPAVVLAARVVVHGAVTAAMHVFAGAAGFGHRMSHTRRSDSQEVGSLARSWRRLREKMKINWR